MARKRGRRLIPCEVCERPGPPRYPLSRPQLCTEHAIRRALDNAQQLHEHQGPAYDAWLRAMRAHFPPPA